MSVENLCTQPEVILAHPGHNVEERRQLMNFKEDILRMIIAGARSPHIATSSYLPLLGQMVGNRHCRGVPKYVGARVVLHLSGQKLREVVGGEADPITTPTLLACQTQIRAQQSPNKSHRILILGLQ